MSNYAGRLAEERNEWAERATKAEAECMTLRKVIAELERTIDMMADHADDARIASLKVEEAKLSGYRAAGSLRQGSTK